jgi:hypothetical protein
MNDELKQIIILELLAFIGLIIPIVLSLIGAWQIGIIFIVFWWFVPGMPYPFLHLFIGGYMPFIAAYPACLIMSCQDYFEVDVQVPV